MTRPRRGGGCRAIGPCQSRAPPSAAAAETELCPAPAPPPRSTPDCTRKRIRELYFGNRFVIRVRTRDLHIGHAAPPARTVDRPACAAACPRGGARVKSLPTIAPFPSIRTEFESLWLNIKCNRLVSQPILVSTVSMPAPARRGAAPREAQSSLASAARPRRGTCVENIRLVDALLVCKNMALIYYRRNIRY
jgi:hypothetical protein